MASNECEERKETEQMPITKEIMQAIDDEEDEEDISGQISESDYQQDNGDIRQLTNKMGNDSSEEMAGIEVEFNEMERTVAQKSIRRSVVKDKLNWSCHFGSGILSKTKKPALQGINQKAFMDSRGAAAAIKAKRSYNISETALLFDLSMPNKELKFISINMLSSNLKLIDLQNNKLESLPEEISNLRYLEKLKVDHNRLTELPAKLSQLERLQTLTASNNALKSLPAGIEELIRLEILLINDNKIRDLTAKIGNLSQLKKLFLHSNQL